MRYQLLFSAIVTILFSADAFSQNTFPGSGAAGIGTVSPNSSSLLDISSTTKGVLVPRMTKNQRDAIISPVMGLIIFQTNSTPGLYYYTGAAWTAVSSKGANATLSNLGATTAINSSLLPGTDSLPDLGSAGKSWKDIYLDNAVYLDGSKFIHNTGTANAFVGSGSGFSNSTGIYNTAIGYQSLWSNNTGNSNTANGVFALYANTSGSSNIASGLQALTSNTTGSQNTAYGNGALSANTSGGYNTASGNGALQFNSAGSNATAIGYRAMYYANSTTTPFDNYNVAVGFEALRGSSTAADNTGNSNTAIGYQTLWSNTTGHDNVANGQSALYFNTTGYYNTACGLEALNDNTTGSSNTAVGNAALTNNTTGVTNVAIGEYALYGNTEGHWNTACGAFAGLNYSTGNYRTFLGHNTNVGSLGLVNCIAIGGNGNLAIIVSNNARIGNSSITSIGGQVGWTTVSDMRIKTEVQENVPGLSFINELRPVTYVYNKDKEDELMGITDSSSYSEKYDIEKIRFTGFLAQEVENAAQNIGYDFSGVDKPGNEKDLYGLRYAEFVVPLVKSVQELSLQDEGLKTEDVRQNEEVEKLKSEIENLKSLLEVKNSLNDGAVQLEISDLQSPTILGQNIPNPFDQSTIIPFRIPKDCNDASIVIAETGTGRIVTAIPISCSETHLMIEPGKLASGSYSYSLYVDGILIATKQMVLTK